MIDADHSQRWPVLARLTRIAGNDNALTAEIRRRSFVLDASAM